MSQETLLGIDVGGSKIELVAYRLAASAPQAMEAVFRKRVATPTQQLPAFVQALAELVQEAEDALGLQACPLGIGLPGLRDGQTGLQISSNVPCLHKQPVVELLEKRLGRGGRRLAFGNDCQCFALSEAYGGAAAQARSMFGAILGTGAGGGFCADGRLLRGAQGLAGEWGHMAVPARLALHYQLPLVACGCGLQGCLETYVSGSGMRRLHQFFSGRVSEPAAIAAAAEAGDAAARHTLDCYFDLLGYGLAQLVLLLDPEVLVLGGGLSQMPLMYQRLPAAMRPHLFAQVRPPRVLPPRFGDAGGSRGAALLALPS
ncbi:N-acetylglucosamine kinase [Paucibacter oligotrophus]|uniref:N-acetylglucosamine kinase n=1 Tax=Roseateles oligotrophus TaxID=1769250 RepID=A0A840LCT9_9BURK|nr:ROK family protein [Roseateles oligotrophus]MBB4844462.1 N-acetylglucosamine kinase [Roseateles oligotrophus]